MAAYIDFFGDDIRISVSHGEQYSTLKISSGTGNDHSVVNLFTSDHGLVEALEKAFVDYTNHKRPFDEPLQATIGPGAKRIKIEEEH